MDWFLAVVMFASGALLHGVDVCLLQLVKSREIHHSCPSLHSYCAPEHGAGNGEMVAGGSSKLGRYQLYKLYHVISLLDKYIVMLFGGLEVLRF